MGMTCEYTVLTAEGLAGWAAQRKRGGWQFVQMCAVRTDDGIDLLYTLRREGVVETATVAIGVDDHVPSVTDQWLAAFVFENEAHDLFGVNIDGIAIDFEGNFYRLAQEKPMMVLSPAQIAEREKAAKIKAAQEAKKAKEQAATASVEKAEGADGGSDDAKRSDFDTAPAAPEEGGADHE